MVDIKDLTLGQIEQLRAVCGSGVPDSHPYPVGGNVFVRTVTYHYVGRLVRVHPRELVLTHASWVADDGRFHVAIRDGVLNEVEPYPDGEVVIGRSAVVDLCAWNHPLPREAK